ncbi:MAG: HAMP domain-containing histidine kinase, partial [Candidatus Aminicenantes bacterium]
MSEMSSKLNKINELKAEMMQQVSHELQNPLQLILYAHDMLRTEAFGTLNKKQLFYLDSISNAVEKVSAFSNQYLEIAKIDAGMMEYQLRPMELTIIIQPIVEAAKIIASNKKISLDFSVQGNVPKVMVDPDKIDIVIRNLIDNAIKYTQSGGKVNVSIQPSNIGAKVTITDSGIGIASEHLPEIFDEFYRAPNAKSYKVEGTGLGLAIVKVIVEAHGGDLKVKSELGEGSTFTVSLPKNSQNRK